MVLLFSLWFVNAMPHGKRNVRNHTVFGHLLLITIGIDDLRHGIVVYRKGIVIDDCVCFCIVCGLRSAAPQLKVFAMLPIGTGRKKSLGKFCAKAGKQKILLWIFRKP